MSNRRAHNNNALNNLEQKWRASKGKTEFDLLDETIEDLHELCYNDRKLFIEFWLDWVIRYPVFPGFVEEMLRYTLSFWEFKESQELVELLGKTRDLTVRSALTTECPRSKKKLLKMEYFLIICLCNIPHEGDEHRA